MRFKVIRRVPESWSGVTPRQLVYSSRGQGGEEVTPPASYWTRVVSGEEGTPPPAIGPDVVARGGRGNPLDNLFEEDIL